MDDNMKFIDSILSFLGGRKLVKFSDKNLGELSLNELAELIEDFIDKKFNRFDEAAMEEFLNEKIDDKNVAQFQEKLIILERKLFDDNDNLGLWSLNASEPLRDVLSDIRLKIKGDIVSFPR